jgi:hypothetical protein
MVVVFVPWHTETILPAEITATSQVVCVNQLQPSKLQNLKTSTINTVLINDQQDAIIMIDADCDSASCKVLTVDNISLHCNAPIMNSMEIYGGQDATFFPEHDEINPFHVSVHKLQFSNSITQISGTPFKVNQYFEGTIKGLISIKGERKSLFMRAYTYLSKS